MGEEIESLAKFVAETRWEDVPEGVRQHAKLVLLDTLGVILAGSGRPEVAELRQRLTASRGVGATVYANGWPEADPRTAALLNGIAGRSIELCEGLRFVSGQAAMQVLPGYWRSASTPIAPVATCCRLWCSATMSWRGSPAVHAAPIGASERAGVSIGSGRGGSAAAWARRCRHQQCDANCHSPDADAELYERRGGRYGSERRGRDERVCRGIGPGIGNGRVRGPAQCNRRDARQSHRRRVCSRSSIGRAGLGLAHHPQLLPALRVLQPDTPGTRLPRHGTVGTPPAPRSDRAHRGCDIPLCVGDEEPAAGELFRLEIFAAACRRCDGGARRCLVCSTRRYGIGRSGHCGIAPKGPYQRRSGDERSGAAAAAGPRDANAN